MTADGLGERFGMLVVVAEAGRYGRGVRLWMCRCDCGKMHTSQAWRIKSGVTKSCGCLRRNGGRKGASHPSFKHGNAGTSPTKEYRAWVNMKSRCLNKNNPGYGDYGGRGIRVCREWAASFEAFLADVGRAPGAWASIDRIDNDGHYEPGNVRWATDSEQAANKTRKDGPFQDSWWADLTDW